MRPIFNEAHMSEGAPRWSWKRDLNTRPAHYECAALPTELFQPVSCDLLILQHSFQKVKPFFKKVGNTVDFFL